MTQLNQKDPAPSLVSQRLLKGLSKEEQDRYEKSYRRAKTVLKRINEYAGEEYKKKGFQMETPTSFDTPNWQYLVAWWSGYRYAMRVTQEITRTK